MIKLTRWLSGWVEFSIAGKKKGQAERFLTLCARSGFVLWGMQAGGQESFRCRVRASEYAELRPYARKCRVKLRLMRRRGLVFWMKKLGKRKGLVLGGVWFCLILWILSGRYWVITVSGNQQLAQQSLLQAASEEGLFLGAVREEIDEKALAAALMQRFPEISWVSVNTRMCSAEICLEEGVPKPEEESGEGPSNVLATVDGQILSIDTFDGTAMVQAGDAVTKGQLLISGVKEDRQGGNTLVYARGKIVARTRRTFTAEIPLEQTVSTETGKTKTRWGLQFFGMNLPVTLRTQPKGTWRKESLEIPATLLDTPLPILLTEEVWHEYREEEVTLNRKEAEERAWKIVNLQQAELLGKEGRILTETSKTAVREGKLILTVQAECQEEIGKNSQILLEDDDVKNKQENKGK